MKKLFLSGALLAALMLSSCARPTTSSEIISTSNSSSVEESTSQAENKIYEIYLMYKAAGGEQTYEQWLATIKGEKGDPGASLLSGETTPESNLGQLGDVYLDISAWDIYTKASGGWVKLGNIKGEKGDSGDDGKDGARGISIVSVKKTGNKGVVDTYTITYSDQSISTFTITNGKDGVSIQGEKGEDGHSPIITISTDGYWVIDGEKTETSALGFKGEKGDSIQGEKGEDGISIVSVEKTNTEGLIDTYTISYSDKTTSTFTIINGKDGENGEKGEDGKNGISITSIEKTNTEGLVDTYTISYSDESTSTFTVTNGQDGQSIKGDKGEDGKTPTITVSDDGYWVINDEKTEYSAVGPKGDKGDTGEKGVSVISIIKTDNEGLIDTYTITYSDESTSTFTITNGEKGDAPKVEISEDGYWIIDGEKTEMSAKGKDGVSPIIPEHTVVEITFEDNKFVIHYHNGDEYVIDLAANPLKDTYSLEYNDQVIKFIKDEMPDTPTAINQYHADIGRVKKGDAFTISFEGSPITSNIGACPDDIFNHVANNVDGNYETGFTFHNDSENTQIIFREYESGYDFWISGGGDELHGEEEVVPPLLHMKHDGEWVDIQLKQLPNTEYSPKYYVEDVEVSKDDLLIFDLGNNDYRGAGQLKGALADNYYFNDDEDYLKSVCDGHFNFEVSKYGGGASSDNRKSIKAEMIKSNLPDYYVVNVDDGELPVEMVKSTITASDKQLGIIDKYEAYIGNETIGTKFTFYMNGELMTSGIEIEPDIMSRTTLNAVDGSVRTGFMFRTTSTQYAKAFVTLAKYYDGHYSIFVTNGAGGQLHIYDPAFSYGFYECMYLTVSYDVAEDKVSEEIRQEAEMMLLDFESIFSGTTLTLVPDKTYIIGTNPDSGVDPMEGSFVADTGATTIVLEDSEGDYYGNYVDNELVIHYYEDIIDGITYTIDAHYSL